MDPFTMMMLGSLGSSAAGYFGAQGASSAQADAAQQQLALDQQMYQQDQKNFKPWLTTGSGAEYTLASLYGLPGKNGQVAPANYSAFYNSPDYKFALQQGQQATQNLLSAKGGLASGGGLAALNQFGQGLASQQYQNYVGRLQQIAQGGLTAAQSLGQQSTQYAGLMNNAQGNYGAAKASGIMGEANAIGGAFNSVGGNMGMSSYVNRMNSGVPMGGGMGSPYMNSWGSPSAFNPQQMATAWGGQNVTGIPGMGFS